MQILEPETDTTPSRWELPLRFSVSRYKRGKAAETRASEVIEIETNRTGRSVDL